MADSPIQILVVEADPLMRAGLVACLQQFTDYLQVAAKAETRSSALLLLKERIRTNVRIDLVLLGLPIDFSRQQVSAMLQGSGSANDFCQQVKIINPNLPILLWASSSQDPHLHVAHWLANRILATSQAQIETLTQPPRNRQSALKSGELIPTTTSAITPKALQAEIFDRIAAKLQFNLENLTSTPLEIDLLRLDRKRELYYLILRQFEGLLDELRFSQVTIDRLSAKQSMIWQDLWASVTTDFFGRYYHISALDMMANAVIQPLLNYFSNSDEVKSRFFDRRIGLICRGVIKGVGNIWQILIIANNKG